MHANKLMRQHEQDQEKMRQEVNKLRHLLKGRMFSMGTCTQASTLDAKNLLQSLKPKSL